MARIEFGSLSIERMPTILQISIEYFDFVSIILPMLKIANEPQSGTSTEIQTRTKNQTALPWTVIVYDDPINLMQYVTMVFKKVFGYSEEKATVLMMQVHQKGRSLVWSGEKEKAEFYVQQLHSFQLKASLEQES